MKELLAPVTTRNRNAARGAAVLLSLLAWLPAVQAQSTCSSDGQPQPQRLLERFINADCENCWKDSATPKAANDQAVLDWVVPGSRGDDAPLAAVATRDALMRLQTLKKSQPQGTSVVAGSVKPLKAAVLRVAHGIALSGYIGASIELKPVPSAAQGQVLTAWLALVETIPAGTEGSPVERNLVRNVLVSNWNAHHQLSKEDRVRFFDARSMSVAQGVNADRLRVIGWVEDAQGRVVSAAQSFCAPESGKLTAVLRPAAGSAIGPGL